MRRRLGNTLSTETPLILIGKEGQKRVVVAVDQAAKKLGIKPRMAVAKASAMVANLHVEYTDAAGDQEALEKLSHWAFRHYSPAVMPDRDGLLIEATGVSHLFGEEEALLNDILAKLKAANINAQIAMAPTYGAAYLLARYSAKKGPKIIGNDIFSEIRKLPITGLRISQETIEDLQHLGFELVEELLKAPRASLALRFGSEIGKRLDQALGHLNEPFERKIPQECTSVSKNLAEPISTAEVLSRYILKLVEKLSLQLESRNLGARRLELEFSRVDNRKEYIRIGLAKPTRNIKQLSRLLTDKLEKIDPGFGIERITLTAVWSESLTFHQCATDFAGDQQPGIASLIDTLSNRLGSDHLYQFIPVESDVPERCVKTASLPSLPSYSDDIIYFNRPTRLLPEPEPIETIALLPDHPPVSFIWRGKRRKVVCADGPERIFGEWWKNDSEFEAVRDYFQVEDEEGRRFWVFRKGDGVSQESGNQRWYVHGLFG